MEIKININVCRVCLKPPVEPVSLFSDHDPATTTTATSGHAGGGGGAGAGGAGGAAGGVAVSQGASQSVVGGGSHMGILARQFTAVTQLEVSLDKS